MKILAGDIGGTKTWLQIANVSGEMNSPAEKEITVLFERRYASTQYASFDTMLLEFCGAAAQAGISHPEFACMGVAGLVERDAAGNAHAKVTNLPWRLDAQVLESQFQLRHVCLINDFQAIAYGLERLSDDELAVIQQGTSAGPTAPRALIGAGTGLGQALLVYCDEGAGAGHSMVISSEGGHADFAPGSREQLELANYLANKQQRVSVEDVLSGRGLVNIYDFLASQSPGDVSESLAAEVRGGDGAAAVSNAAAAGTDTLAAHALDLFLAIYGSQAGNFALACMARGGVYIAGGIAPKMPQRFMGESFRKAFCEKGAMHHLMETIPVMLVLNPQVGLRGAAVVASRAAGKR